LPAIDCPSRSSTVSKLPDDGFTANGAVRVMQLGTSRRSVQTEPGSVGDHRKPGEAGHATWSVSSRRRTRELI
jgi:hypothetical protein